MADKKKKGFLGMLASADTVVGKLRAEKKNVQEAMVCPECGTKNDRIAMCCKICGMHLADEPEKNSAFPEYVIGGDDYDPYPVAGEQGGTIPTHLGEKVEVQPEPYQSDDSLRREIDLAGKTIGRQELEVTTDYLLPVTGWIVGVSGQAYGKCHILKSGKNRIGLSPEMDAVILCREEPVQRTIAMIVYNGKENAFFILPGESDVLCYVNDSALYEQRRLTGFETIELGDGGLNVFKFVPLCGEQFSWNNLQ